MINLQNTCDFRDWNHEKSEVKLKVYWSFRGVIKKIRNQLPTCKRHSKLGMTNEVDRDVIA
jgi:hypothetical protein